ncbi:hypothetical protein KHA80_21150 [Anaerobacillus sp. HL2]|nr:hypothetical protein KHA80_21150 [Anaerobacillus sp. HL2]
MKSTKKQYQEFINNKNVDEKFIEFSSGTNERLDHQLEETKK